MSGGAGHITAAYPRGGGGGQVSRSGQGVWCRCRGSGNTHGGGGCSGDARGASRGETRGSGRRGAPREEDEDVTGSEV